LAFWHFFAIWQFFGVFSLSSSHNKPRLASLLNKKKSSFLSFLTFLGLWHFFRLASDHNKLFFFWLNTKISSNYNKILL
jgi:hypothetical protein